MYNKINNMYESRGNVLTKKENYALYEIQKTIAEKNSGHKALDYWDDYHSDHWHY